MTSLRFLQLKVTPEQAKLLPGNQIMEIFEQFETISTISTKGKFPEILFRVVFNNPNAIERFDQLEAFEITEILENNQTSALFSAYTKGPIPMLIHSNPETWIHTPSTISKYSGLFLTVLGTSKGLKKFRDTTEAIFDAGEMIVRNYLKKIPNGEYVGSGQMDSNGVEEGTVPFDLKVIIEDEKVILDMSNAPPQQNGPINCPLPSTVSTARVSMSMLAGSNEPPNEGFFRPIEVITKPGTLFHPISPAPCFLYGWPALQAIEVFYRALGTKFPENVPASSGGCINGIVWWGIREETGEPWADGAPHPVGQGASHFGDGATCLHHAESATRFAPAEVWENRNPWLINKVELIQDSCGAGKNRGGLGVNFEFEMLEDSFATTVCERSKLPPWGLNGGLEALPNNCFLMEDGKTNREVPKATRVPIKKGNKILLQCGGGGGYGDPKERDHNKIIDDVKQGYLSKEYVNKYYPDVKL